MALSDFAEKIGKLITTTVTLSEDVKRAEGNIKDFQLQLRDNVKATDSVNGKLERLNTFIADYEQIKTTVANLQNDLNILKAMHEAEYKAHAQELEIARLKLEAQMDERFRKLEANFSTYANNVMNSITSLSLTAGISKAGEIPSIFDHNARQLPPKSED
jgi:hypothetical protein